METNNYELDAEAEKFIESTYQKVIFEDALKNGNTCMVLYGPDSSSYFARNDSVVIGFRYDEFAENGLDDNAWDELHDKQVIYIYSLLKEMNANIQGILPTPMSILRYNDFSIKKRNLNEKIMENDEEER